MDDLDAVLLERVSDLARRQSENARTAVEVLHELDLLSFIDRPPFLGVRRFEGIVAFLRATQGPAVTVALKTAIATETTEPGSTEPEEASPRSNDALRRHHVALIGRGPGRTQATRDSLRWPCVPFP